MNQNELELLKKKIVANIIDFAVNNSEDGVGCFKGEVILDEDAENSPYADVDCMVYTDGYREDDYVCGYMCGTNVYIVTSVDIALKIEAYDENGKCVYIDTDEIRDHIEYYLK